MKRWNRTASCTWMWSWRDNCTFGDGGNSWWTRQGRSLCPGAFSLAGDPAGRSVQLRFDLAAGNSSAGFAMGYGRIYMLDYAYNEARSDMAALGAWAASGRKASQRSPSQGHGRKCELYLGSGGHCTARGIPDGCEQRQVTWFGER
ncbi:MAG: hypothetical protein ACLU9S_00825 [Oscillospiraceae bacterium]